MARRRTSQVGRGGTGCRRGRAVRPPESGRRSREVGCRARLGDRSREPSVPASVKDRAPRDRSAGLRGAMRARDRWERTPGTPRDRSAGPGSSVRATAGSGLGGGNRPFARDDDAPGCPRIGHRHLGRPFCRRYRLFWPLVWPGCSSKGAPASARLSSTCASSVSRSRWHVPVRCVGARRNCLPRKPAAAGNARPQASFNRQSGRRPAP